MAAPAVKLIIFDCFGVLYVDSRKSLLETIPAGQRQELTDLFQSNNYGYFDRSTYLERAADITGMTTAELTDYFAHEHRLNTELTTYIREQLRPMYKIGMLSNIGRGWMDDFFSKHQLHELFDEVVLSGEEGMVKPQPAIFELMAERMRIPTSECLMIDDILDNCDGARAAGMEAIHYQDNEQLLFELKNRLAVNRQD
jgi:HAD superfamily hydrolase (TIGR01509 family)